MNLAIFSLAPIPGKSDLLPRPDKGMNLDRTRRTKIMW